jgi:hypothetical protein
MTEYSVLYSDKDVEVTRQNIRVGGATYSLSHIISVRLQDVDPRAGRGASAVVLGLLILAWGWASDWREIMWIGGVTAIFGVVYTLGGKLNYEVQVETSRKKEAIFVTQDKRRATQIVKAIERGLQR